MSEPSRKLSSEEVNALMDGLKSGDLSASTSVKDGAEIEYKKFNFGSDDLSLLGDYYALRLINERFARTVRGVFLPLLRVQPRISSFPPEVKSFEEYSRETPIFKLWHLNHESLTSYGKDQTLFTFYELDHPTSYEINIARNQKNLIVSSNYAKNILQEHGIENCHYVPLGFDKYRFIL